MGFMKVTTPVAYIYLEICKLRHYTLVRSGHNSIVTLPVLLLFLYLFGGDARRISRHNGVTAK